MPMAAIAFWPKYPTITVSVIQTKDWLSIPKTTGNAKERILTFNLLGR